MIRRAWTVQATFTVLLAFGGAPFLHLHSAELHGHDVQPGHRHQTFVHLHLPETHVAPSSADHHGAELSHARHDAKPLEVFALVPNDAPVLTLPFLVEARIELVPAPVSIDRPVLQSTPRTHDPPLLDPTGPRAPPA